MSLNHFYPNDDKINSSTFQFHVWLSFSPHSRDEEEEKKDVGNECDEPMFAEVDEEEVKEGRG